MAGLDHRLRQRLEQSVQVERPPGDGDVIGEFLGISRIAGFAEGAEEKSQRLQLERADSGVVDEPGIAHGRRDDHFAQHLVGAGHPIECDIERIEEMAARRRERAELRRVRHEQSVERIDADEIGAGRRRDLGEAGEILEIAHAPVALRAQAVDLAGNAPATAVAQPAGHEAGNAVRRLHRSGVAGRDGGQALGHGALVGGGNAQRRQRGAQRRCRRGDHRPHEGPVAALDTGALCQPVKVVAHFRAFPLFRIMVSPASMIRVRPSSSSV